MDANEIGADVWCQEGGALQNDRCLHDPKESRWANMSLWCDSDGIYLKYKLRFIYSCDGYVLIFVLWFSWLNLTANKALKRTRESLVLSTRSCPCRLVVACARRLTSC